MTARPVPKWLPLVAAATIGALTAAQARINGQLGLRLDDGILAAAISFGSGLVIVVALALLLPAGRAGTARLVSGMRSGDISWWMLGGGAAGALTVATQGLTVAIIGTSLFTVGFVAGQTMCGLFLDRVGFGPGGVVAVTLPRIAGGALALLAVVVSLTGGGLSRVPLWMLLLPFIAGIGVAWQQAVNGQLRQRVGTPLTATVVSFIVGTVILVVIAATRIAIEGKTSVWPAEPWLYAGGVLGGIYIFLGAATVAYTGVLLLGLGSIAGQLVTSLVLDLLWPAAESPGLAIELVVVTVALASVVVAVVPWRRRPRPGRGIH